MLKKVNVVLLVVALILAGVLFLGFLTSYLWNVALVPQGLKPIDTATGVALNVLGTIMFGGSALSFANRSKKK